MTKSRTTSNRLFLPAAALVLGATPLITACDTGPSDPVAAAQAAIADGAPRIAFEYVNTALSEDPDNADLQMMAGDLAIALGNPDRAVSEFERIVAGPNSSSLAKAKLAEAQLMGNYMGAARESVESLDYDVPLAYTAAIGIEMADGKLASAYERLDEGLAKFPNDPRLLTIDAERLWTIAKRDAARARLAPALKVTPIIPQSHVLAGQMAMSARDLDAASDHFESVLTVRPSHQTALLALAAIASDRGDDVAAAAWVQKASAGGYTHPLGMLLLAQIAYDAGDMLRAFELIETLPAKVASEPEFARLRGFIDAARDQHGSAILALKGYVEYNPGDLMAQRVLAQSYAAEGELDNAWRTIAPVVDHPQADGGMLLLALSLSEATGKGNEARIRERIAARDNAPDIAEPMLAAGKAIRAGDWAKADSIYAPLVDGKGKDDPVLLNNAAAIKSKLGDHGAAVTLARRALAKAPQSPQILDTLGWALWQKGGAEAEARQMLTKARNAAPNDREIAAHWIAAHPDR